MLTNLRMELFQALDVTPLFSGEGSLSGCNPVRDERLLRLRARLTMSTPEDPVEVPGQLQDRAGNKPLRSFHNL